MNNLNNLSISVFCWNLQSVRYSSQAQNTSTVNSVRYSTINSVRYSSQVLDVNNEKPQADFIDSIVDKLNTSIIVIALQEDSIRDSPILNLIKEKLINYSEIDSIELSGWGSTTYKALKNNLEYLPRGLRLSVFQDKQLNITTKTRTSSYVCPSIRDKITWGKGAVAIHLNIDGKQITIANIHLPFSSKGLRDPEVRKDNLNWQITCLNYIYENLANEDSLIIAGDLNFRIDLDAEEIDFDSDRLKEIYKKHDELRRAMDLNKLPHMLEGVDNNGIDFPPTCKLNQDRKSGELKFNIGKKKQRTPSWCDRILYKNLNCITYERFEHGNMNLSDHAAVIGKFII